MNVRELKKLLENVQDEVPVVCHNMEMNVFYTVETAGSLQLCKSHDGDYGQYVDPNDDGRYEGEPTLIVFVVGLP